MNIIYVFIQASAEPVISIWIMMRLSINFLCCVWVDKKDKRQGEREEKVTKKNNRIQRREEMEEQLIEDDT